VDVPIKNSSSSGGAVVVDATKNSNLTALQQQTEDNAPLKLPVTLLQSDLSESFDAGSSESNLSEESQDCENIDNISFELVTG
jgi:hypothetical protein